MERQVTFNFISWIRAFAALAVVWDHLVGLWLDLNKHPYIPLTVVRTYVSGPLGIIQDFGFLAVVLFFLVSGFIITHALQKETRSSFMIRRIFRIYPALIISVFAIFFAYQLAHYITGKQNYLSPYSIIDALSNSVLINFLFKNQNIMSGVTWTLVIEMIFYVFSFALFPILKKNQILASVIQLLLCFIIIYFSHDENVNFLNFASIVSFIPYLLLGQLLYFLWTNILSIKTFFLLTIANFSVILFGIKQMHVEFLSPNNSYPISLVIGYLIFILLLLLEKHIVRNRIVDFISKISYSLYLNHYMLGMLFISELINYTKIPYTLALLITLILVTLISFISFKWIEEPFNKLGKRLFNRRSKIKDDQTFFRNYVEMDK